ncbi:MAG: GNAT family N-acetyltransferase [Rhabdochlamydiaceae bacterium]
MTVTFRKTTMEDRPYLISWLDDPDILKWFPMTNRAEIEDSVNFWMHHMAIGACLTACIDEKPCGFANLYIPSLKRLAHQCLLAIIVDPFKRGQGIGSSLMDEIAHLAKVSFKIEILHLEVYENNPAISLYQRKGFIKYGEHPRFIKIENQYMSKILLQKRI